MWGEVEHNEFMVDLHSALGSAKYVNRVSLRMDYTMFLDFLANVDNERCALCELEGACLTRDMRMYGCDARIQGPSF